MCANHPIRVEIDVLSLRLGTIRTHDCLFVQQQLTDYRVRSHTQRPTRRWRSSNGACRTARADSRSAHA